MTFSQVMSRCSKWRNCY